jgi:hypothetical protein
MIRLSEKAALSHFCVLRSADPSSFDIEAIHHLIDLYAFITGRHDSSARHDNCVTFLMALSIAS